MVYLVLVAALAAASTFACVERIRRQQPDRWQATLSWSDGVSGISVTTATHWRRSRAEKELLEWLDNQEEPDVSVIALSSWKTR